MSVSRRVVIASLLLGAAHALRGDSPAIPRDEIACSSNAKYCLATLVDDRPRSPRLLIDGGLRKAYPVAGLYRAASSPDAQPELLWRMEARGLPEPLVLNDGEHLIAVARGSYLGSDQKPMGSEPLLHFVRRGALTRVWTLAEIVPVWRSQLPERTVSHLKYEWLSNVALSPDERTLEIKPWQAFYRRLFVLLGMLPETLRFDTRTGARR